MYGLIDIHTHGGGGFDFNSARHEEIGRILDFYKANGVSGVLATIMTDEPAVMLRQLRRIAKVAAERKEILGVHLEGPFLSSEKAGVMPKEFLRAPNLRFFDECQEAAGGIIKMITVAPELYGGIAFIKEMTKRKIVVSLGHSNADYATAMEGVKAGASCFTHLFNAMRPLSHRETGIVGAALLSNCYVEIICDGVHLSPETVRLISKIKDKEKIILVTDSVAGAGMGDGEFAIGNQNIILKNGRITLCGSDTLAGSALTAAQAVKNFAEFTGHSESDAQNCMTKNPKKLLNIN